MHSVRSTLASFLFVTVFGLNLSWAFFAQHSAYAVEDSAASKKIEPPKTTIYLLCRLKSGQRNIARTLKVVNIQQEERMCNTIYTKFGVDRVVGWGRTEAGCLKILKNIQANLKTAGWKCKDISSAKVSRSSLAGSSE